MKEQIAKGKSKKLKQVAEEHTRETHNPKRIDKTKEEMLIITKKKKPEALKLLREDGKLYIEISKIEGIPTELRINGFICRVIMEREYSIQSLVNEVYRFMRRKPPTVESRKIPYSKDKRIVNFRGEKWVSESIEEDLLWILKLSGYKPVITLNNENVEIEDGVGTEEKECSETIDPGENVELFTNINKDILLTKASTKAKARSEWKAGVRHITIKEYPFEKYEMIKVIVNDFELPRIYCVKSFDEEVSSIVFVVAAFAGLPQPRITFKETEKGETVIMINGKQAGFTTNTLEGDVDIALKHLKITSTISVLTIGKEIEMVLASTRPVETVRKGGTLWIYREPLK